MDHFDCNLECSLAASCMDQGTCHLLPIRLASGFSTAGMSINMYFVFASHVTCQSTVEKGWEKTGRSSFLQSLPTAG